MNSPAQKLIAQKFLSGFFDTVDALLAVGITAEMGAPIEATAESIDELITTHSIFMQGNVDNTGIIAVIMKPKDAMYFAATVMGEDPPEGEIESVPENKMSSVQEVFDSCLGGGCGTLKETCEKELSFGDISVTTAASGDGAAMVENLGGSGAKVPFSFSTPSGIEGSGFVLVSSALESLLPPEVLASLPDPIESGPAISPDEMGDILGGFDPGVADKPATKSAVPKNLDMVMDISLVCTARLGRVVMPIGEILEMGPGSIIEVGHLIDEPVELLVNEKLIARGDVVVVDEKFGLRITEIISPAERIKSLQ